MAKPAKKETRTAVALSAAPDEESIGRYVRAAGLAKKGLTKAMRLLRRQKRRAKIDDRLWYTDQISALKEEFNEVQSDLLAFLDETLSFTPPTPSEFAKIQSLAKSLDNLIANAKAAKSVIVAATKLADGVQALS